MSLIKWEPFDDIDRAFRDLSLFPVMRMSNLNVDMACDVYEDGPNVIAEMNLPGLDGKNIEVAIEDDHLHIAGRREEVEEKKDKNHYSREIKRGAFERIVPLPSPVRSDGVEAEYEHGVLKVTMPKREDVVKSNKIEVKIK